MCAFNLSIKLRPIPFAPCSLDLTKTPPGQAVSLPSTSSILVTESNIFAPSSSLSGCRCGRSGSSLFLGGFLLLRLSNRGLARAVHSCSDWCRYKYTCHPSGFLAADGCRPKRSGFSFRGRFRLNHAGMTFLKILRFSDDLCLSFCPKRRSCTPKFLSCRLF